MSVDLMNLWSIFLKGGPVMWPLLILSILSVTIIIDKCLYLLKLRRSWLRLREQFFELIEESKLKDAAIYCDQMPLLMGRALKAGVLKNGSSKETIMTVMEQAMAVEANEIKKNMSLLSCIVNLAPLLGLLATTVGLTVVFHAVHMRSNALNPLSLGDMASGIWQALIATSAGLGIGSIAFVGHAFLAQQINDLLNSTEESMQALSNKVCSQGVGDHAR